MLFEFFTHIYVKSPHQYETRWLQTKAELDRFGLQFERFSQNIIGSNPIEKEKCATDDLFAMIQDAKDKGYRNFMTFEDDSLIDDKHLVNFPKVIDFLNNNKWHMFSFGFNSVRPEIPVSENIVRITRAWCFHGIAINSSAYDLILQYRHPEKEGDMTIADKIQPLGLCYGVRPRMVIQRDGFSYLQNTELSYNYCLKD